MTEEQSTVIVIPELELDLAGAVAVQRAYLQACQALLNENDYSNINGRRFRKRSGWAKLRRAFRISCSVVSEARVEIGDDWGYLVGVRASFPNGRFEESDGACMASEYAGDRVPPTLPNVRAKAFTRAKSRATSDILGAGIVSAEEIGGKTKHWIDDSQVRKRFWAYAKDTLGLTNGKVYGALRVNNVRDFKGTMSMAKLALEAFAIDEEEA